jgi:hypothetical protein
MEADAMVIIQRKPFTQEEREAIADAIMFGCSVDGLPELDDIAMDIAEKLPELLRHARLPDTSEHRRKLIDLVMRRWSMPKGPRRSRAYRTLARR